MFDIGGFELLILIIVALVILKPEDLPKAMQTFGRIIRKINRIGRDFYNLVDDVAYEIEEKEQKAKKDGDISDTNE